MENFITADQVIDLRDVRGNLLAELKALENLLSETRGRGGDHDWRGDWYPLLLIRDDYMEDYCKELAVDCGMISGKESWPLDCIDWERATERFKEDYTKIEFMGETYWYR